MRLDARIERLERARLAAMPAAAELPKAFTSADWSDEEIDALILGEMTPALTEKQANTAWDHSSVADLSEEELIEIITSAQNVILRKREGAAAACTTI